MHDIQKAQDLKIKVVEKLRDQLNAMLRAADAIHKAGSHDPNIVVDILGAQGYDSLDTLYGNIANLRSTLIRLEKKWSM